jgi:phytoene dehydrogenase-like protein
MSKGVYTFQGGTDRLIRLMREEMRRNGVDICTACEVQKVHVEGRKIVGATIGGHRVGCRAVVSNANLLGTIFHLVGEEHFEKDFAEEARAVRLNNSSAQVYMALKPGETLDENVCGDLLFSSTAPEFRTEWLLSREITSRTYSFYYPRTRPGHDRCYVVASTNANYRDWADLAAEDYEASKRDLIETTLQGIEKYAPNFREKLAYAEAATPKTFERYTRHWGGSSFGTKFEGLAVSRGLPERIAGLYHAGSVGIIMSGWLGAVNYGVIVANDVDAFLMNA